MKTQTTYLESKYHFIFISMLFTLMLFSLRTFGQNFYAFKPTQILFEEWENPNWNNTLRVINTYDASKYLTGTLTQSWDAPTSTWLDFSKVIYTNNANGTPSTELYQMWDSDSGLWIDYSRIRHTYSPSGKLAVTETEQWFGMWKLTSKLINTYDGNGYLTKALTQQADIFSGILQNNFQTDFTNFGNGLVNFAITQKWNIITGIWENSARVTNVYKPNNKILIVTSEKWVSGNWVNDSKQTYTYDGTDYVTKVLSEKWNVAPPGWTNDSQTIVVNNATGIPTQLIFQDWDGMAWVNTTRITLTYTALGLNDFGNEKIFTVYPIPAYDSVTIKSDNNIEGAQYFIFDETGRVFQRGILDADATTIDIHQLSTGVFFCQIGNDRNQTVKIIKR